MTYMDYLNCYCYTSDYACMRQDTKIFLQCFHSCSLDIKAFWQHLIFTFLFRELI